MSLISKKKQDSANAAGKKNWYKDRYQYVVVQRNWLALFAMLALIVALATTIVLYELVPLKTVEPFVIQVDDRTGFTQIVKPYTAKEINANEAVKEYFLVKYIRAREGYSPTTASENYRNVVRLLSSQPIYRIFSRNVSARNPQSPLNVFGQHTKRNVEFKSITYLKPNEVLVRIKTYTEKISDDSSDVSHYVIRLKFDFAELTLLQWERYINPLGFIVTEYTRDEEYIGQ